MKTDPESVSFFSRRLSINQYSNQYGNQYGIDLFMLRLLCSRLFYQKMRCVLLPGLTAVLLVYAVFPVLAAAPENMQAIREDLRAIDRQFFSERVSGAGSKNQNQNEIGRQPQLEPITVTLSKTNIRARDVYRRYMTQAAEVSQQLLHVRRDILDNGGSVSLQRLGAISQGLNSQNVLLKNALQNGESDFESYQLIQKAIAALDDATQYWRSANRYRPIYRGAGFEENEDNQLLKVKLQTAMTAIEQLQRIVDTQNTLQKGLEKAEF